MDSCNIVTEHFVLKLDQCLLQFPGLFTLPVEHKAALVLTRGQTQTDQAKQDFHVARYWIRFVDSQEKFSIICPIIPSAKIITGSFIKAYAVDRLTERMLELGINDAIINAGGSTIMAINNESHPRWQVMVRHPQTEEVLFKLNIANQAYSTSSQSKTFVSIDGKEYGHILNPITGFPSANKQVGIISDNCMIGDMISTALFNESAEGFLKKIDLLSEHYNIKGFMLDSDNNIIYTQDFR